MADYVLSAQADVVGKRVLEVGPRMSSERERWSAGFVFETVSVSTLRGEGRMDCTHMHVCACVRDGQA